MSLYQSALTLTAAMFADISEQVGGLLALSDTTVALQLRRGNRWLSD